jgi:lysophospholipase L1-like esterase
VLLLVGVSVVVLLLRPRAPANADRVGSSAQTTARAARTAVVVADSLATVTAPGGPNIAYPLVAGRLLGWQVRLDAHAGTGFSTPDGLDAQHPSFAARVRSFAGSDPSVVVVALGSDDVAAAAPGRAVEVLTTAARQLADLRQRLPGARIVVLGPLPSGGTPSATLLAVRGALQIAAQVARVLFIDPIAEGWITGDQAHPLSGNAAQMLAADGRHLTPAGHANVGLRLATDLSRLGI